VTISVAYTHTPCMVQARWVRGLGQVDEISEVTMSIASEEFLSWDVWAVELALDLQPMVNRPS
jgi:hypothetical protein